MHFGFVRVECSTITRPWHSVTDLSDLQIAFSNRSQRHLLARSVLHERIEHAAAKIQCNTGQRKDVEADSAKGEHSDERLDDRFQSSSDAGRQRRVVGRAQEEQIVEQTTEYDDRRKRQQEPDV